MCCCCKDGRWRREGKKSSSLNSFDSVFAHITAEFSSLIACGKIYYPNYGGWYPFETTLAVQKFKHHHFYAAMYALCGLERECRKDWSFFARDYQFVFLSSSPHQSVGPCIRKNTLSKFNKVDLELRYSEENFYTKKLGFFLHSGILTCCKLRQK